MYKSAAIVISLSILPIALLAQDAKPAYLAKDYGGYTLQEVPSADVDKILPIADGRNGMTPALQGLWWLDGAPTPDEVVSFAQASWDEKLRKATITVYDENIWTWHGNESGAALYGFVRSINLIYDVEFNADMSRFNIIPNVTIKGQSFEVPTWILRFAGTKVDDDHYVRDSYLFGQLINSYDFRRLVQADGTRTSSFDAYLKQAPELSLIPKKS